MLKKDIKKFDVLALAIGAIIGAGAFILPGTTFLKVGLVNSVIAIFLGSFIMVGVEKNYGFLLQELPVAGGEYAFAYESFGWKHGLICGWFLTLSYTSLIPFNATGLTFITDVIAPKLFKVGYLYTIEGSKIYLGEISLVIFVLALFAFFNIVGVKLASQFQNIIVIILVGIIFLFFSVTLAKIGLHDQYTDTFFKNQSVNLPSILQVLSISPMLFVGFNCISQVAEELEFKAEDASKLAMFSILGGALIYCIIIYLTSFGVTFKDITSGSIPWATGHTIEFYFGKIGLYALGLALASSIVAGINGFYMASSRLVFAMARGKILPSFFGELDPKYGTPKNAILFILVASLVAPWFGQNVGKWIVGTSSVGASIGYLYTSLASYKRYKEKYNKVFIPAIFGSISGVIFLILLLCPGLKSSLSLPSLIVVVVWGLLGLLFYKFYDQKIEHYNNEELDDIILHKLKSKK